MGGKRWTDADIEFVRGAIGGMTAQAIAKQLGRTPSSIWKLLMREGIEAPRGPRVPHKDYLRRVAGVLPMGALVEATGRGPRTILDQLKRLHIPREGKKHGPVTYHGGGIRLKWTKSEFSRLNEVLEWRYLGKERPREVTYMASEWLRERRKGGSGV